MMDGLWYAMIMGLGGWTVRSRGGYVFCGDVVDKLLHGIGKTSTPAFGK